MGYVVYLTLEQSEREQKENTTSYDAECARYGGTTYIVDNVNADDVALCVDTDVFLLQPKELVKNDRKEIKTASSPRPGNN